MAPSCAPQFRAIVVDQVRWGRSVADVAAALGAAVPLRMTTTGPLGGGRPGCQGRRVDRGDGTSRGTLT